MTFLRPIMASLQLNSPLPSLPSHCSHVPRLSAPSSLFPWALMDGRQGCPGWAGGYNPCSFICLHHPGIRPLLQKNKCTGATKCSGACGFGKHGRKGSGQSWPSSSHLRAVWPWSCQLPGQIRVSPLQFSHLLTHPLFSPLGIV